MSTGKAAHPTVTLMGTWGDKCPSVLDLFSGVGVIVELLVHVTWTVLLQVTQEDLPQAPEWCTGIPVLAHSAAIAVFHIAAIGLAFRLYVCVCVCVCTCVCTYIM